MRTILMVALCCCLGASVQAQGVGYIVIPGIANGPASVIIDGTEVGILSNRELTLEAKPGSRRVLIKREGYADFQRSVEVRSGDVVQLEVRLVPRQVRVIQDEPEQGATLQLLARVRVVHLDPVRVPIQLNGSVIGQTPSLLEVPAGELVMKIGATPLCLRVRPYDSALVRVRAGALEELRDIWRCDDPEAPPAQPDPAEYTGNREADLRRRAARQQAAEADLARQRQAAFESSVVKRFRDYNRECVLTREGAVLCKGENKYGELGFGDTMNHTEFARVPLSEPVRSFDMKGLSACAITVSASVICWGHLSPRAYPDLRPGQLDLPVPVDTLAMGSGFACARGRDSTAYCWGSNLYGELGRGNTGSSAKQPAPIQGNWKVKQLVTTSSTACALTDHGDVICWGDKESGRLGRSIILADGSGDPHRIAGNRKYTSLRSPGYGTFCAVGVDQVEYCWGDDYGSRAKPARQD